MKSNRRSTLKRISAVKYLLLLAISPLLSHPAIAVSNIEQLDQQREQYLSTLHAIKKGRKNSSESLASYPLHNYLLKAKLQRKLHRLPYEEVDSFLAVEGQTIAARQLLSSWLRVLAKKQQWQQFLSYYDSQLNSTTLRCWQLEALHQTGHSEQALNKTEVLWLVGKSQPKACDAPFKRWQKAGRVSDTLLWQRANLAINAKNYQLARFLLEQGSSELANYGKKLLKVNRKPSQLTRQANFNPEQAYDRDIVVRGLKKLANQDIELATKLWVDYRQRFAFSQPQLNDIRQAMARQLIASNAPQASWSNNPPSVLPLSPASAR